jgi:hypothetical protein
VAEDAADAMADGLRHIQMGVERLDVRLRVGGGIGCSLLLSVWGGLDVPLLWRRGDSFMKRWSVSLDVYSSSEVVAELNWVRVMMLQQMFLCLDFEKVASGELEQDEEEDGDV